MRLFKKKNKQEKHNNHNSEPESDSIQGYYVKYSVETAKVNPQMILDTYNKVVKNKEIELESYENCSVKILINKDIVNIIDRFVHELDKGNKQMFEKIFFFDDNEPIPVSVPQEFAKLIYDKQEEFNKIKSETVRIKRELHHIKNERGEFRAKFINNL